MPNVFDQFDAPSGPIMGPARPRDPYKDADEVRADAGEVRDVVRTGIAQRGEGRDIDSTAFNQKSKLLNDYEGLAPVKEYRASLNALASALKTSGDATGDNALIYAYAKIMDPASVVRESEMAMAGSGDSTINALAAKFKKEFGLDEGGQLSPQVRERLRREAINSVSQRVKVYNGQRDRFSEMARRNGFDPYEVVGDHDGKPFIDDFKNYGKPRDPDNASSIQRAFDSGASYDEIMEISRREGVADPNTGDLIKAIKYRDEGGTGAKVTNPDGSAVPDAERDTFMGAVDAGVRGVADVVTLGFADEIAAAGDTIFNGGTMDQNLSRQRGTDRQDERVNPYARLSGQVAGGFALPGAGVTGVGRTAALGAGYGGGYGFGTGEGGITDRLINAGKGAAVGGVVGGALGGVASRLSSGGGPGGGNSASELMAAAQRQGIDILPADVGGAVTQRMTAGMAQTPFGGAPIINRAQTVNDGVGARLTAVAQREGAPQRQEVFGDTVKAAADGYEKQSGRIGGKLYDDARAMVPNARLEGKTARTNIDNQLASLAETPNTSADLITGLKKLGDDMPKGKKLSIDAIRRLRTNVRSESQTEGLRATDYQRRAGLVLDDLANDIESQLPKEAAAAFRKADDFWKERLVNIDDVMSEVIGPQGGRSAEKVTERLVSMSRGDSGRLRTFVGTLNPEESGIVRGSLIQEMGRARASSQGAEGQAFSLETFLTNWDKMPERTRALLFKGDSRAALEDLAKIADGARSSRRFANTSNTAGASGVGGYISGGLSISTLGATIPLEMVTGRLLASPRFARILASKMDKPAALKKLSRIAAREPAIAPDIQPILSALSAGPQRAAAEDN